MDINVVLRNLERVTSCGDNQWTARCPAHDDEHPSLSVKFTGDKILFYCHSAGCSFYEILQALGEDAGNHAYCVKKNLTGIKSFREKDKIWLPIHDHEGITGFQSIDSKGKKLFSKGSKIKGKFTLLGRPSGEIILICEGWATGVSLKQATGHPVAVAFSANNLVSVAKAIRTQFESAEIILCSDNDPVGATEAEKAAATVGGKMTVPDGKIGIDFNDIGSHEKIREWVESARTVVWVANSKGRGVKIKKGRLDIVLDIMRSENLGIWYDSFQETVYLKDKPLTDSAIGTLRELLLRNHRINAGKEMATDCIDIIAHEHECDPLMDYFGSLHWDGEERIRHIPGECFEISATEYSTEIFKRFLCGATERALNPGCIHRIVLILSGAENIGKSLFCRDLCPNPEWFSDYLPRDLHTKEAIEALLGKFIVESAELASFRRSEQEAIKAYFSRPVDYVRLAYRRFPVRYKRRAVVIGTTNAEQFLAFDAEGTRFWPIKVMAYNREWLVNNRDQIWAETLKMYRSGFKWWDIPPALAWIIREQREDFKEEDYWLAVLSALSGLETNMEACISILQIPSERVNRSVETRIGALMKKLGWVRSRKRVSSKLIYVYKREEGT